MKRIGHNLRHVADMTRRTANHYFVVLSIMPQEGTFDLL